MIRHIVMFNLRPDVEPSDREWLFDQIRALSKIPSAQRVAVNRLLDAREEWYKARISTDFEYALTMEFENEDGLYAYQNDPYHLSVAQEIRKRTSAVKVVDFMTVERGEVHAAAH